MSSESLPITALIATIRGWPTCGQAVTLIAEQVARVGGEFIVADGSQNPPPTAQEVEALGGSVRWISLPGQSVFQLRHAGYQAARGEVVAITEDHCYVASDWIERVIEAHKEHPDAAAIGCTVVNNTD